MQRLQLIAERCRSTLLAWSRDDRAVVAMMFGICAVPLMLIIGLAIDYGFYQRAVTQLNIAADAAAMQAVRVASQAYGGGSQTIPQIIQTGQTAGQQWFAAQAGVLNNASVPAGNIKVIVNYTTAPSQFTAAVTYNGTVTPFFGALAGVKTFPISGSANAVIGNSYVEVAMLLDDSGSMLIGSTPADIVAMEKATPCSTAANVENNPMDGVYAWLYTNNYGYNYNNDQPPPGNAINGNCDPLYDGDASQCIYPANIPNVSSNNTWFCTNKGGKVQIYNGSTYYLAQAPCGFACHDRTDGNDYFALIRGLSPKVTLRFDVVQTAAINVIATLKKQAAIPNQFSVALTTFHNQTTQVYPTSGEAGTDMDAASTAAGQMAANQPVTTIPTDTYFSVAVNSMSQQLTAAGNGQTPSTPLKNIFIVTDGMENSQTKGPMTTTTNEAICKKFWDLGITVYVLYTPYTPLVHNQYLYQLMGFVEPSKNNPDVDPPNIAALKACARYPGNFFVASDPAAINNAMQAMLASALNSPGRVTQ